MNMQSKEGVFMVGGKLIEVKRMGDRVRLWCVGTGCECWDETAVIAAMPSDGVLPSIGDMIWWQSGKIFFDKDRRNLLKIGNSFDPPNDE